MRFRCWAGHASPLEGADANRSYGRYACCVERVRPSVSGKPLHAPSLTALTGFSRSSIPSHQLGSGSAESPLRVSPSLGLTAVLRSVREYYGYGPELGSSTGLCPDQEHPDVEPQFRHTVQDPAGTVEAPQSMQGFRSGGNTTVSSSWGDVSSTMRDS
jgi:hypothetical protein